MGRCNCSCTSSYKCGCCLKASFSSCRVYDPCGTGCKPKCNTGGCDKPHGLGRLEIEILMARIAECCDQIPEIQTDIVELQACCTTGIAGYQLISNMVDTLKGDLTGKYPSALLLLDELKKLWECVYTRHKHYGEWSANVVTQTIIDNNDNCLTEGENSVAVLSQVKIDIGDTVTHNGSVWMSLCNDNDTEPLIGNCWLDLGSISAVLEGVKDLAACPSVGLLEFDNCADMEAYTGTAECPLRNNQLAVTVEGDCFELYKFVQNVTTTPLAGEDCDNYVGSVVSTTSKWVNYLYCNEIETRLTVVETCCTDATGRLNGLESCCADVKGRLTVVEGFNALPSGAQDFDNVISGTLTVPATPTTAPDLTDGNGGDYYYFNSKTVTFTTTEYPILAEVGHILVIEGITTQSSYMDIADTTSAPNVTGLIHQWDTVADCNGVSLKTFSDLWCTNTSGAFSGNTDIWTSEFTTDGTNISITVKSIYCKKPAYADVNDTMNIDYSKTLVTLSLKS